MNKWMDAKGDKKVPVKGSFQAYRVELNKPVASRKTVADLKTLQGRVHVNLARADTANPAPRLNPLDPHSPRPHSPHALPQSRPRPLGHVRNSPPTSWQSTGRYSIAMGAACPFPANHGSAASIREMSDTLTDMGHNVTIVTYPIGQEDIHVRSAKVRRTAPFRPETNAQVGPSADKFLPDFTLLTLLCREIRKAVVAVIHAHK